MSAIDFTFTMSASDDVSGRKYTVYNLTVKAGDKEYTIQRRYSEFLDLFKKLKSIVPGEVNDYFPSKKMFGSRTSKTIETRIYRISQYLNQAAKYPAVQNNPEFAYFMELESYGVNAQPDTAVVETKAKEEISKAQSSVSVQESKAAIAECLEKDFFAGMWRFTFTFLKVDITQGGGGRDSVVGSMGAYMSGGGAPSRGRGRGRGAGRRMSQRPGGVVNLLRPGSILKRPITLESKAGGYLKGSLQDLGVLGRDGTVTGSIVKSIGKINIQVQLKRGEATMSINCVARLSSDNKMHGTFSGCEISRAAESVTGTFEAEKWDLESGSDDDVDGEESPEAGGGGGAGEGGDATPSDTDAESPAAEGGAEKDNENTASKDEE